MIIEVGEIVPPDRSDDPMTDHSKTASNPGPQAIGPRRHAALQRWRAPHVAARSGRRQVLA
jgi:hypothetical protein